MVDGHSDASPDDEALVRTIQERPGSREAETASNLLLDRWQERVYRWTRRFVSNREDALDLTQEILVLMMRGLPRYESRGNFGGWVFTIVRYRCLSAVRRRSLSVDPELELESLVSPAPGPHAETEWRDREERVLAAMQTALDPRERLALWLRAYEGMSVEDITHRLALGASSGARGLLQTARRKLRAALGESEASS